MTPGAESSEYRLTHRAQLVAFVLVFLGLVSLVLAIPGFVPILLGALLLVAGVLLFAVVTVGYAHSRGRVKAATARRPDVHTHHAGKVF